MRRWGTRRLARSMALGSRNGVTHWAMSWNGDRVGGELSMTLLRHGLTVRHWAGLHGVKGSVVAL